MDDDVRIDEAIALTRDRERDQLDSDDVPGESAGLGERHRVRDQRGRDHPTLDGLEPGGRIEVEQLAEPGGRGEC